jgi:hypothetical protein
LTSKSLSQSRYEPSTSTYIPGSILKKNKSRWGDDLKNKNEKYDFNMFSNYINNTFQVPSRAPKEPYTQSRLAGNMNKYDKPTYLGSKTYKYQEQPLTTTNYIRSPIMTESKYIRSSSANNQIPGGISVTTTPTYLQTNQYNITQTPNPKGSKTYRVIRGTPTTEFLPRTFERVVQKEPVYISSTGGRLSNLKSARLSKGTTRYEGGNRQGLVQSMYKEKPSNLLEMKYGNVTSTGMRY